MRRSVWVFMAAAIVGMGVVGTPASAGPKPKPGILFTADVSPGSFAENSVASFQINVNRTGQLRCAASVSWAITDVTTTSGSDYNAGASGTLSFAKNTTTMPVSVTMVNDTRAESSETFTFTLSGATTPCKGGIVASVGPAQTVTITDSDPPPVVFTVPAGGYFQVRNASLGTCDETWARVWVPGQFFDLAHRTGCGTTIISEFIWRNPSESPVVVKIGIVDAQCNYDEFYNDKTTWNHGASQLTSVDHASVAVKTTGGWDVDITDGGGGGAGCWVDNVPAVNTGNLSADVTILGPAG